MLFSLKKKVLPFLAIWMNLEDIKTQHWKNEDHCIQYHHFMANGWGNNGNSERLYFLGLQNHCRWWLQPWNSKILAPWKKRYDKTRQHIKKQRNYFVNKGPSSQSQDFCSSPVWMWELNHKKLSVEKLMLLNCGTGEDSWESLGLQGDQTSQRKSRQRSLACCSP